MTNSRRPSITKRSYHLTLVAFITMTMVISSLVAFEPTSAWPFRGNHQPIAVQTVTLEQDSASPNEINGAVQVQSRGVAVSGAQVFVTFTYPDGRTVSLDASTSRAGWASFVQPADGNGEYTLAVTDIKRKFYRYDASLNTVSSASVTVGGVDPESVSTQDTPESIVAAENTATDAVAAGECAAPAGTDVWHEPTDHEHGDAPPAWANEFSCQQFGHPVIFGGDEQTPNENLNKHHAFIGFNGSDDGYDLYFRVHAQSNPMGRSVPYHSFEAYVLDASGNVSMIQGWLDFGTFADSREFRGPNGDPSERPAIFGASEQVGSEQWYSRPGGNAASGQKGGVENEITGAFNSGWYPDVSFMFMDASTLFSFEEDSYVHDISQWPVTGDMGTNRVAGFHWYESRIPDTLKGGAFYATQFGEIVSGPDDPVCSGTTTVYGSTYQNTCLYQTIADTVTGNVSMSPNHRIDCPSCTLPN